MDTFFALLALALVGVIIIAAVKQENRIFGICLSVALCVVLVLLLLPQFSQVISQVESLMQKMDGNISKWVSLLLKVTVIALLGEWGISVCRDAGESALSVKLEIAVKILLLVMALPVLLELLEMIFKVLEDIKSA